MDHCCSQITPQIIIMDKCSQPTNTKCSIKGCPYKTVSPVIACAHDGCANVCHRECYNFLATRKNGLEPLAECSGFEDVAVCTKKHYDTVKKKALRSSKDNNNVNVAWNKDGKNGPDDPNTSESIILDWWNTFDNYNDFCNGARGKKKIQQVAELSQKMSNAGCIKQRSDHGVLVKVQCWEKIQNSFGFFKRNRRGHQGT